MGASTSKFVIGAAALLVIAIGAFYALRDEPTPEQPGTGIMETEELADREPMPLREETVAGDEREFQPPLLESIYFGFDSYVLQPSTRELVRSHARWLSQHPQARVRLEGHADERGTEEYNMVLSERRARSVRDALRRQGIEGSRIEMVAYGKGKPALPNAQTDQEHARNRRVELRVEQ